MASFPICRQALFSLLLEIKISMQMIDSRSRSLNSCFKIAKYMYSIVQPQLLLFSI